MEFLDHWKSINEFRYIFLDTFVHICVILSCTGQNTQDGGVCHPMTLNTDCKIINIYIDKLFFFFHQVFSQKTALYLNND